MTEPATSKPNRHFEVYRTLSEQHPDNLWGQVGASLRAVGNRAEQLVNTIASGIGLRAGDVLLDLGCGNGVLTDLVFSRCAGGLGVDVTESLIATAQNRFARHDRRYMLSDLCRYLAIETSPEQFTKSLCEGSFQYLWPEDARKTLELLCMRFTNVSAIFLGALPDRDKLSVFFGDRPVPDGFPDTPESHIGIWRSAAEVVQLGEETGWHVEICPCVPWEAAFRFDAVLRR